MLFDGPPESILSDWQYLGSEQRSICMDIRLAAYLANGNAAVSVPMTAVSTIAAMVMTPLNLALWGILVFMAGVYMGGLTTLTPESAGVQKFGKGAGLMAVIYGAVLLVGSLAGQGGKGKADPGEGRREGFGGRPHLFFSSARRSSRGGAATVSSSRVRSVKGSDRLRVRVVEPSRNICNSRMKCCSTHNSNSKPKPSASNSWSINYRYCGAGALAAHRRN